jgi:guanylate kinase
MGKIFCLMGKSSTGKDSIYRALFARGKLPVKRVIPYTTRPIREGEKNGNEYFFCTEEDVARLEAEGKIIELRAYNTVYGVWKYFTACDGQMELSKDSYLLIGTLEAYGKLRDYFGKDCVVPVYIEVEDGERLIRAIERERSQKTPKYAEMCRRFLADDADFSEENLRAAGICVRFENLVLEETIEKVESYIRQEVEAHGNQGR